MSLGQIAALIVALAVVAFVCFCAVPLLKLGRVLEEVRLAVRDIGHNSVPVLQELKGTVTATNEELGKLSIVTEDVTKVTNNATVVSAQAAELAKIVNTTVGGPLVRVGAIVYGLRQSVAERRTKRDAAKVRQESGRRAQASDR